MHTVNQRMNYNVENDALPMAPDLSIQCNSRPTNSDTGDQNCGDTNSRTGTRKLERKQSSNTYLLKSMGVTEVKSENKDCKAEGDTSVSDIEFVDTGMSRQSITLISTPVERRSGMPDPYVQEFTFGWFDKVTSVISVILFFVDIGTDINLATTYFKKHKYLWGIETTCIVVIPSLIICGLGLNWYIIDYNKDKQRQHSRCLWFLRIFFTLLQCGPVIRTFEYVYCGYRSQRKDLKPEERYLYYRYMLRHSLDMCLLHLFESFFEAAPQLIIQIYIMISLKPSNNFLHSSVIVLSLVTSWSSLAISLTTYNKSLRINNTQKANMSLKSLPFYFVWRASEIGGRILCIAMFASVFKYWTLLILGLHWVTMSVWLIEQKTTFYRNRCLEIAFNLLCGYVMIFCFLNLREGHTRFRFLIYYCLVYIENFIMLAFWFRFTQDLGAWFHLWGFSAVIVLFIIHQISQLLYYVLFHPTNDIKVCLPCDRFLVYSSMCSDMSAEPENGSKILYNFRLDVEETMSETTMSTAV